MGSVLWTQRSYCLWGWSAVCCLLTLQLLPISVSVPILLTGPPYGFLVKQGGTSQQIWSLLMKQEGTSQQKHIFWKQWDKKQPLTFITLSKNSSNVNTYALSDYSDLQNTTYPLTNYLQGNHLLALVATLIQDIFTCRFITLCLQTFDGIAHMQPHFS